MRSIFTTIPIRGNICFCINKTSNLNRLIFKTQIKKKKEINYYCNKVGRIFANGTANPPSREPIEVSFFK